MAGLTRAPIANDWATSAHFTPHRVRLNCPPRSPTTSDPVLAKLVRPVARSKYAAQAMLRPASAVLPEPSIVYTRHSDQNDRLPRLCYMLQLPIWHRKQKCIIWSMLARQPGLSAPREY